MASGNLRREVLRSFKALHRARRAVFKGDIEALDAARKKINEEFRKNQTVTSEESIKSLVQHSNEATEELMTNVVQFKLVEEDKYRIVMRPEMKLPEILPFKGVRPDSKGPRPDCCKKKSSS